MHRRMFQSTKAAHDRGHSGSGGCPHRQESDFSFICHLWYMNRSYALVGKVGQSCLKAPLYMRISNWNVLSRYGLLTVISAGQLITDDSPHGCRILLSGLVYCFSILLSFHGASFYSVNLERYPESSKLLDSVFVFSNVCKIRWSML